MTPDITTVSPERALDDHEALFALLERWVARGWLRSLDRAFADFLRREVSEASPALLLAAALASHQLGRGHVCLDLALTLETPDLALSLPPEGDSLEEPPPLPSQVMAGLDVATWRAALHQPELVGDGPGATPLVLDGDAERPRLYMRRYWQHEQDIHSRISTRLTIDETTVEAASLRPLLDTLFVPRDAQPAPPLDWQKTACALATRSRFAVITGGPGTGKTTTVVRLLALLQALTLGAGEPALRIRLAAPTGKAAARLNESISGQVGQLPFDSLASQAGIETTPSDGETSPAARLHKAVPQDVSTLHRLLGSRPDTRRFRHDRHNPLPLDVLVVDEASMVDVGMMAALLEALPPHARLVLLGDKDQLASVEAGSILGDLCARADGGHYTPATADWLNDATGQTLPGDYLDADGQPLDQSIAMLRVSHRFTADSGIGQLAAAINAPLDRENEPAEQRRAIQQALSAGFADLSHLKLPKDDERRLARLAVTGYPEGFPKAETSDAAASRTPPVGYQHFLSIMAEQRPADDADHTAFDDWARKVLEAHGHFQLLCALRRGPWGVEGLNERVRQALEKEGLIDSQDGRQLWYPGRPVLVTKNDYGLGLMNGDIGITLAMPRPDANSSDNNPRLLRVAFPAGDGSDRIKWVLPSRLQAVETVFAMTVHKSQGSEFTHAALVLPDAPNPILTRELVYTGITRARHWLTLVETGRGQLLDAAQRRVMRVSGLGS
ncbi:exodeoxyribonuclease V subunit alpha [Halomonas elongata]|uniref:RecBCD enzyme subunit RecD n=1 Tax=Halomonas elongata (strain ATCC 33173 / DSM 2581 / NBRC 15536 / NCIMB 2198 / 1H9) TaxID=768066 RepID=E1V6P0_HALED|nr:exodeoxyribonuclease V subunit alpha [Halomonas elongata]WBF18604.1 exodeoxyribonuclease V subunit alpha [Halomonas elongata]WPU47458.1 exodeoxyribonuclease V subunit alpha [Halomonas elongata DSM 2581]CBV41369.1 RecBCD enzyme subunit RecD [Halomonas elongata DSM 2581]